MIGPDTELDTITETGVDDEIVALKAPFRTMVGQGFEPWEPIGSTVSKPTCMRPLQIVCHHTRSRVRFGISLCNSV